MAITAKLYNTAILNIGNGAVNLSTHTFKIALLKSTGVFVAADDEWADISAHEIAGGYGYTTGGQALTSVVWAQSGGVATFGAADPQWTASGGDIETCYGAVIYSDTSSGKKLLCHIDFGGGKSAEDGSDLNGIIDDALGIFQIASGA